MTTYDLEKYRDKREKVLGVKKKGLSFSMLATMVSVIIIIGLGSLVVPKSVVYLTTRNLDDAIFKRRNNTGWPQDALHHIMKIEGVKLAQTDKGNARMVVTFDRSITNMPDILSAFGEKGYKVVMLNRVNHRQRISTRKEETEREAL